MTLIHNRIVSRLEAHVYAKDVECKKCQMRFLRERELNVHVKLVHGEKKVINTGRVRLKRTNEEEMTLAGSQ